MDTPATKQRPATDGFSRKPLLTDEERAASYAAKRVRTNEILRKASRFSRDISSGGWVHPPVDPHRRDSCRDDLGKFLKTYLGAQFSLPWSPDHLRVIAKIEEAVRDSIIFSVGMPRGSGKTSMCEGACAWGILYGHLRFPILFGSSLKAGKNCHKSVVAQLECNDLIAADFSEIVGPVRSMENIRHRARGQLYNGKPTYMEWTKEKIVMPCIPGSIAAGTIFACAGMFAEFRGTKEVFRADDGSVMQDARPDFFFVEDPQTDESAWSPEQCSKRIAFIKSAIMGMGGPAKQVGGVITCTVIAPNDAADQLLDRKAHPAFHGIRTKMMYSPPANMALWDTYADLRRRGQQADDGGGPKEANAFYVANREKMDEGAVMAWPERFGRDESSAVQHAMNFRFDRGEAAFAAEAQNEPLVEQIGDSNLNPAAIMLRINSVPKREVPLGLERLTAFIDVGDILWWGVCAWGPGFTGAIIEYGSFPDQRREYFTKADARQTLAKMFPTMGLEGRTFAGLKSLSDELISRRYKRLDGAELQIDRFGIDANWGLSTDTVYNFVRQSPWGPKFVPTHGKYVGAATLPWERWEKRPGEIHGHHLIWPVLKPQRAVRHLLIDTNHWKSHVAGRLTTAIADRGALTIYGRDPSAHRLLADHLTSEVGHPVAGRERKTTEWKIKPSRQDNDLFDVVVGCAALASTLGITLDSQPAQVRTPTKRARFYG